MKTIKPIIKNRQLTIGVFTASFPAHVHFREKFDHGINELKKHNFNVKLGSLTEKFTSEGYRSGSIKERALEFMELIEDDSVDILLATIGGYNSSSLLQYLDFEKIKKSRKYICGYSDITSLLLAIYAQTGLSTFYGPAVVPSFGEHPHSFEYSVNSFLHSFIKDKYPRVIKTPDKWSNHFRNAFTDEWKTGEREYNNDNKWIPLKSGEAEGEVIAGNLNTLITLIGTPYLPDFTGKLLFIEDVTRAPAEFERSIAHLKNAGLLSNISALVLSKPEIFKDEDKHIDFNKLLFEIIGDVNYPIVTDFDCGHTHPMVTLSQGCKIKLEVDSDVKITILEPMIQ